MLKLAMAMTILGLSVTIASAAQANETEWLRLPNNNAYCALSRTGDTATHYFAVQSYIGGQAEYVVKVQASGELLNELMLRCSAALAQAKADRQDIFINMSTGQMMPQDGFFVRAKRK